MSPSTAYFPLRMSVELFSDPTSPDAVTGAKQAAALFDRLIFEVGLLDVTITATGGSTFWLPPDHLTPERLAHLRRPVELGGPFVVAVGREEKYGVPAPPRDDADADPGRGERGLPR